MAKARRHHWEVKPSRIGIGWEVTRDGLMIHWALFKKSAITVAVACCSDGWHMFRVKSELRIKDRKGVIQDARTYGNDPRRSKG